MDAQTKSLKQAINTLIREVQNNRCHKLALRDALDGLSLQDSNKIAPCMHRNASECVRSLTLLLASVMEIIVVTNRGGKIARMNYGTDEKQAIEVLKYFKLHNITAHIEIE